MIRKGLAFFFFIQNAQGTVAQQTAPLPLPGIGPGACSGKFPFNSQGVSRSRDVFRGECCEGRGVGVLWVFSRCRLVGGTCRLSSVQRHEVPLVASWPVEGGGLSACGFWIGFRVL